VAAAIVAGLAPASAHAQAQRFSTFRFDVWVDGRGGLQVIHQGADGSGEFAPANLQPTVAGLELRQGASASLPGGDDRVNRQPPAFNQVGDVRSFTSRYDVGALEVTEIVSAALDDPHVELEYRFRNLGQSALTFNAAEIADVASPGDGRATGEAGDTFVGTRDRLGRRVGLVAPTPPWLRREVDSPAEVRTNFRAGNGLDNSVSDGLEDLAVGAEWEPVTLPPAPDANPQHTIKVAWRFDPYVNPIVVNQTVDGGNGICDAAQCTLREALGAAVPSMTVELGADTYSVTEGELTVDRDVHLVGRGARTTTIQGNGASRLINLQQGHLTIRDLKLTNGNAQDSPDLPGPFALAPTVGEDQGGAIAAQPGTDLYLERVAVVGNRARSAGGGIASESRVDILSSLIANNTVEDGDGGGIAAFPPPNQNGSAATTIENSTLSGNTARQDATDGDEGTGRGGGIYVGNQLTQYSVTIANNSSRSDQPLSGGGAYRATGVGVVARSTLMAGNLPLACGAAEPQQIDTDYNMVSDQSCQLAGPHDRNGINPQILALADNGGPTDTHALPPGSPAIDAADPAVCPYRADGDQRGVRRPQGDYCDIGAYEASVEPLEPVAHVSGRPLEVAADGIGRLQVRHNTDPYGTFDRDGEIGEAGMAVMLDGTYFPAGGPDVYEGPEGRRTPISGPTVASPAPGVRTITSKYWLGTELEVTETATYRDGSRVAELSYRFKNLTNEPVSFRAAQLATLRENATGVRGSGFLAARTANGAQTRLLQRTPFDGYQVGRYDHASDVYAAFTDDGLDDRVDPELSEQIGVEWQRTVAAGGTATIDVAWELTDPTTILQVNREVDHPVDDSNTPCTVIDCTLREALAQADPGTVVLVPEGDYQLERGALTVDNDVTVIGAGARQTVIRADEDGARVFDVYATLGLAGVRVTGGRVQWRDEDSGEGGGIRAALGALALVDSVVDDNAGTRGGGVFVDGALSIVRSTLSDNRATHFENGQTGFLYGGYGGGAELDELQASIVNSTFSGNSASRQGGGIYSAAGGRLANVTIANNEAPEGAGLRFLGGDRRLASGRQLVAMSVSATIVDANEGGDECLIGGNLRSDHSLAGDDSCGFSGPGDLQNADARLGPLADNGGPTRTHALLAESPAIGVGGPGCATTDQRGTLRPRDGGCEAGAVELGPPPGPPAAPVITAPAQDALLNDADVLVGGTAAPGATVEVNLDGGEPSDVAVAAGNGAWQVTLDGLDDGPHSVTATATDVNGTSAPSAARTFSVDTSPPPAPEVGEPVDVQGQSFTLTGQADPRSTVTIFDGETPIGTTTAGEDGRWSFAIANATPGDHAYSAIATDPAGNTSPRSPARTVSVAQPQQDQPPVPTPIPTPPPPPPPPPPVELPPPVVGRQVNAEVKSGTVKIRLPGTNRFIELDAGQQIPVGTTVDAKRGRITLTSAADNRGGTQTADFYDGIFRISQTRGARPITELRLVEQLTCPRGRKAQAAATRKRRLWGNGRGRFRTRGQYSAATVRGTIWLTEDRCGSTVTRVRQGRVQVRDFVARKIVVVRAPRSYTARARRR
jgi:CSLREA domain-containing protein